MVDKIPLIMDLTENEFDLMIEALSHREESLRFIELEAEKADRVLGLKYMIKRRQDEYKNSKRDCRC